ncbi:MAG: NAD(P)/FAD-dependent oxidoreductase [Rickettsiaceae bacterium]|nr:NAD(P)/FAD-dependent oxidoreductase [Rickettsiaceae bacterium]
MLQTDVLIIGAGPVGLFASFEAGLLGMKTVIVDGLKIIGGQCKALYPEKPIYDIPGFSEISGASLIDKLESQSSRFRPIYILGEQLISFSKDGEHFVSVTDKQTHIKSKIILIAGGGGSFSPNKPPLKNLGEYENKSVFFSIDNVSKFYGKKIVIAGGGDSAIDWALALADKASKLYLIHRREKFKAAPASAGELARLSAKGLIEIIAPYQLKDLDGQNGILTHVIICDLSENIKKIEADILLLFFGLTNDLGPLKNWGLELSSGSIKVDQASQMTNIEGIYAIGDICYYNGKLKLILTGFAEAACALHHAYSKVFDGKILHFQHSTSKNFKS